MVSLNSWSQLCSYVAKQMASGSFHDWPLYENDEEIGSDSTGGTEVGVYAEIMLKNVLTLDSQEGVCTPFKPITNDIQKLQFDDVLFKEEQRSYVTAVLPEQIAIELLPRLREESNFFYLWMDYTAKVIKTNMPKDGLALTNIITRSKKQIESTEAMTTLPELSTLREGRDTLKTLLAWESVNRSLMSNDVKRLKVGYLSIVEKSFCSVGETAGRLLHRLLYNTNSGLKTHIIDPVTQRCVRVGGPTWRRLVREHGETMVDRYPSC